MLIHVKLTFPDQIDGRVKQGIAGNLVAPGLRRLRKSWCILSMFCIDNYSKSIIIKGT